MFNASIRFRPVGDTRSWESCPSFSIARSTPEALAAQVQHEIHALTQQPTDPQYEIGPISYQETCDACDGTGQRMVKPKGWRRRTPPPRWMLRAVPCEMCQGKEGG